jgi:hypothetical protein
MMYLLQLLGRHALPFSWSMLLFVLVMIIMAYAAGWL